MPTWDLDTWIAYYKYRRKYIKLQKQNNTENILHLQFEELIYNYEESLTKIKRFLSLGDTEHIKKVKFLFRKNQKQIRSCLENIRNMQKILKKSKKNYPNSVTRILMNKQNTRNRVK